MADAAGLPQLDGGVFLTDGGAETDLIFRRGIELPEFASFVLHDSPRSEAPVRDYFVDYLRIAGDAELGLILETLTWRASADWGAGLGYDATRLHDTNRRAVELLQELRDEHGNGPVLISGCVGPRDDAYAGMGSMDPDEAAEYHGTQVGVLAASGVDLVSALTLTNTDEAIGFARAARSFGVPAVVSFTVETDGRLPTGVTLGDAIRLVDDATDSSPAHYMVNCAHPDHFHDALLDPDPALARIRGVRANASRLSHAELDEREDLDDGDPVEFGGQLASLHAGLDHLDVLGGCCGTDARHIAEIARALRD